MDDRLLPGEKLFVQIMNEEGKVSKTLEVQSRSYSWRDNVRDNKDNLLFRFYELLDAANKLDTKNVDDLIEYTKRFPVLHKIAINEISFLIDHGTLLITWPAYVPLGVSPGVVMTIPIAGNPAAMPNKIDRLYNNWACFMMAVPLHRQKEVVSFFQTLVTSRDEIVNWLFDWWKLKQDNRAEFDKIFETHRMNKRIQQIVSVVQRNTTFRGTGIDLYGHRTTRSKLFENLIRENLRNLISKEFGNSLYRLFVNMKKYRAGKTLIKIHEDQPKITHKTKT